MILPVLMPAGFFLMNWTAVRVREKSNGQGKNSFLKKLQIPEKVCIFAVRN
jgi:hypothetical protein